MDGWMGIIHFFPSLYPATPPFLLFCSCPGNNALSFGLESGLGPESRRLAAEAKKKFIVSASTIEFLPGIERCRLLDKPLMSLEVNFKVNWRRCTNLA